MTRRRLAGFTVLGVLLIGLLAFGGLRFYKSSPAQKSGYSTNLTELRDRFNADKGKVRLLMLLAPTCPGCLRGASEVQADVLNQIKDDRLRVYSVWVPILFSDAERAVPRAAKRFRDQRVTHYWDGRDELVEAYKTILPTKREDTGEYIQAWDVYLLFPPDAEWKDKPPAPSYWMHQLPLDPTKSLDGETLAGEVRGLLK